MHPLENINIPSAALVAVFGYGVVFLGLILLLIAVTVLCKAFSAKKKEAPEEIAPTPVVEVPAPKLAPGTAGNVKLHDVDPKTAAMLMAIVADKMGKPLSELRFLSIKEVKK